jgi:hypothetical protein
MQRLVLSLAVVLGAVALTLASTASASVRIGSSMTGAPNAGAFGCGGPPCTHSQSALPGVSVASPVNGRIVRWRFQWSTFGGTARLRVIRPLTPSPLFSASSAVETAGNPANTNDFTASVPISIGDRIGIDNIGAAAGNAVGLFPVTGAATQDWDPAPPDGSATTPTFVSPDFELFLNADVEPTSAFTIGKLTKKPKKGTAKLTVSLPNPGQLQVEGVGGKSASAAAGITKPVNLPVPSAGDMVVTLKPSKKAQARLKEKGKASGRVQLTYTPIYGFTPATQTARVGLRLSP